MHDFKTTGSSSHSDPPYSFSISTIFFSAFLNANVLSASFVIESRSADIGERPSVVGVADEDD